MIHEPTAKTAPHPLRASAGPLTAALTLARIFPHLAATSIEATGRQLTIRLHHADAEAFGAWVDELGLDIMPPLRFQLHDEQHERLEAFGEYAEMRVRVYAHPDRVLAVAA
ncbi:hypothetical protein F4556_005212 [Kitasatospora gansuensis]|uniref:Uncharacterized protein n=1 Tax=Kitasatospora gansuensis TaxID=258050 RepID=A0A7W7WJB3_9ACTN|nr:hypothetical protein [Kitasatospora gansuensis]MBB4949677.1 hypothetical protein [Kitasatospora gansuensis]